MDAQVLTTLINNVGFPIATFFVCAFYIKNRVIPLCFLYNNKRGLKILTISSSFLLLISKLGLLSR